MTPFKTHIALRVSDLEQSIAFYRAMLNREPVKHMLDYAKFDLDNPALNLTLNLSPTAPSSGALSHLGIQVNSTIEVQAAMQRFTAAGLDWTAETDTDCCYALQDKVWVSDPDGNRWEIFVVKIANTAPDQMIGATSEPETASTARSYCPPSCCA